MVKLELFEKMSLEEKIEYKKLEKYCISKNFDETYMLILIVTIKNCDNRQTWMEAINKAREFYESRPKLEK